MQKFVVKKISRSTNILLSSESDQSLSPVSSNCDKSQKTNGNEGHVEASSVRMCGYLKKKRNRVGGWSKLYFVLQNSLLMSYNSKEEYEKKLVSFKDVICLIPNNTVLLPSLEPRFTIATNLHTFYTFRCDDNRTASKWITAILECLSRDFNHITSSHDNNNSKRTTCGNGKPKAFLSQPNLSPKLKSQYNHSWEHLSPTTHQPNWIVTHNGRILMELNYKNLNRSNRANLPIAGNTAKLLQKCSDNDVITTTTNNIHQQHSQQQQQQQRVKFIQQHHHQQQQRHDENQNLIRNDDHDESSQISDRYNRYDEPKLHSIDLSLTKQKKDLKSRFFKNSKKSESRQNLELSSGYNTTQKKVENTYAGLGVEEQTAAISLYEETGEYSSIYQDMRSVDSKKLNNTLNIELDNGGDDNTTTIPIYSEVDKSKKKQSRDAKNSPMNNLNHPDDVDVYEDIEFYHAPGRPKIADDESVIYEAIDIPLKSTQKSRSLVWKNWSTRIHLLDFAKRFRGSTENLTPSSSTETLSRRQKVTLTLSDFSKKFNYRSMRNKAKKFYNRNSNNNQQQQTETATTDVTEHESNHDINDDKKEIS